MAGSRILIRVYRSFALHDSKRHLAALVLLTLLGTYMHLVLIRLIQPFSARPLNHTLRLASPGASFIWLHASICLCLKLTDLM